MPKHIMFQQRTNDNVFYITDEMEDMSFMKYKDFIKFLGQSFYIDEWALMKNELDSFEKVFIDMQSKKWQTVQDAPGNYSLKELIALNKTEEEKPLHTKLSTTIVGLFNQVGRHNVIKPK